MSKSLLCKWNESLFWFCLHIIYHVLLDVTWMEKKRCRQEIGCFDDVTCTRPRALQTFLWKAPKWQSAAWEENQRPRPSLECLMGIWIGLSSVKCSAAYCQSGFYVWCLYILYKRTNVLKHHDGKVFLHFFCACVVYICQQNKEAAEAWGQTKRANWRHCCRAIVRATVCSHTFRCGRVLSSLL